MKTLQAARILRWLRRPEDYPQAPIASTEGLILQHRIELGAAGVQSAPALEAGKQHNLAVACAHFDGRQISPSTPFSFWRLLGRPTAARGFQPGTELRDGCVVPSIGGGLCLLSGALFRLAAELDWEILERHGHTRSSVDLRGVDATVLWPQVDLRFAPREGQAVLRVQLRDSMLRVEAYGQRSGTPVRVWRELVPPRNCNQERTQSRVLRAKPKGPPELLGIDHKQPLAEGLRRNCLTCEESACRARPALVEVMR